MYRAFTIDYNKKTNVIFSQCRVSQAASMQQLRQNTAHPPLKDFNAIWDTGATRSAISSNVVKALNLQPIGKCKNSTAAGIIEASVYLINVVLPNNVEIPMLQVSEGMLNGTDILIGMDVISQGDFCLTACGNNTHFTFQIPSSHDVDYVSEINKINKIHQSWVKHGINKCPCNSGKQWINCHGKP